MSMNTKKEIKICLGSSCFSRGNKEILNIIKTYLKEHKLEHKVYFHGAHCFGKCSDGPNLQFGETFYENVNDSNIIEIIQKELQE